MGKLLVINWLADYDFMLRACLAGMGISLVAGPMGSLMIWRRMACFGDALAHSTLLGVSIALLISINIYFSLFSLCLLVAIMLVGLSKRHYLAYDTILGILSHTLLALGLIVATQLKEIRVDLLGYLYGDILSVTWQDIYWVFGISIMSLMSLIKLWHQLLSITIHEELAIVEGVAVVRVKWAYVIIMSMIFAIAMKLIGALLIIALFVIPPSIARSFATTPAQMAIGGSLFSMLSVFIGLWASLHWDWPAGPAIAVSATFMFMLSLFIKRLL